MKEYCQYAETAVARGVTEAPHASQKPQKERGAGEEGKGGRENALYMECRCVCLAVRE